VSPLAQQARRGEPSSADELGVGRISSADGLGVGRISSADEPD